MKDLTEGMQRLCAVANRIVAQNGKADRIEIDLLLEDLRNLYDVALQMGGDRMPVENDALPESHLEPSPVEEHEAEPREDEKMMAMMTTMAAMTPEPEPVVVPEPEPVVVPEPETVVVPEPESVVIPEPEPLVVPEPEPVVVPKPDPEPMPVEQPRMEDLEQNDNGLLFDEIVIEPEVSVKQEPEEAPKASGQASLLDYLKQPVTRTLGETLATAQPMQTLEKKVDDLRTVININDKFSFMSELFKGNMKAYNDFIMRLNVTSQRDEALAHVHDIAAQYKWDEESATVRAFYKIFDKKF